MRGIIVFIGAIAATIILCTDFSDARGIHHHRRQEDSSESESNEGYIQRRRGGRNEARTSESEPSRHSRYRGRGFWDDVGSLAKKASVSVYDSAKKVDWKAVAVKTKDVGAAAFKEAKKKNRKKRSFESIPLPAEQVLSDYLDDQETPKTLYKKRSVRKFEKKAYFNTKNQL